MKINPIELKGNWVAGWVLDIHTIKSSFVLKGLYETQRSEIGELLYNVKYESDRDKINAIAKTASEFLKKWSLSLNLSAMLPVPPSKTTREFQPVLEIAKEIGNFSPIPVDLNYLIKVETTGELKEILDYDTRIEILKGVYTLKDYRYNAKNIMLFDDLYRSGATMNTLTDLLRKKGNVDKVYVLTLTKTRVKR